MLNEMNALNEMTNKGANYMKKMKQLLKNQKGLTLIELLAVIVILAIVAAIAVPAIGNIIDNSRYSAIKADATNVLSGAQLYFTDNPEATDATVTVQKLMDEKYLESPGKIDPTATVTKARPHKLNATVTFSGSKTATFTNATITGINADTQKGSAATLTAITK